MFCATYSLLVVSIYFVVRDYSLCDLACFCFCKQPLRVSLRALCDLSCQCKLQVRHVFCATDLFRMMYSVIRASFVIYLVRAAGEFYSPELTLCADFYSVSVRLPCYCSGT